MWNWVTSLTGELFKLGNAVKKFVAGITLIPRAFVKGLITIASVWVGVFVIVIIFVLWRKFKK